MASKPLWEGRSSRKDTLHADLRAALINRVECAECFTKYDARRIRCPNCMTDNPVAPRRRADDADVSTDVD
jgi:hypothetical protein